MDSNKKIEIDGSEHGPEECAGDRFCHERLCPKCKVWLHFQAMYGSQAYVCPECDHAEG